MKTKCTTNVQMCMCVCMSGVHMLWFHINFSLVKMLQLLEQCTSCLRLREVPCGCATAIKLHTYISVNHLFEFSFEKYLEH